MNKQETSIVILLFALLIGWGFFQAKYLQPPPRKPVAHGNATNGASRVSETNGAAATETNRAPTVEATVEATLAPASTNAPVVSEDEGHTGNATTNLLANGVMEVELTSWGGSVSAVKLKEYRADRDKASGPLTLDFRHGPALSVGGVPGLSTNNDFSVSVNGTEARIERTTREGLAFHRTMRMGEGYLVKVVDVYSNTTEQPILLRPRSVTVGPMNDIQSAVSQSGGYAYLGVDSLPAAGGEKIVHWGSQIPSFFGVKGGMFGCGRQDATFLPMGVTHAMRTPVAWVAAKNKFFVQILAPSATTADAEIRAERADTPNKTFSLRTVSASVSFPEATLLPGAAVAVETEYFVGPKEYSSLKPLQKHYAGVMEFGYWFGWLCEILLWLLVAIYRLLPNVEILSVHGYGIAILVLTGLVRLVLWPLTHKSSKSMKEMQKLQPLVNEIREKYKDKPQKMNQEVMDLYKAHKVNPMAGCLPILLQLPVFFALFTVLRSAVELRFAEFLWIKDLTEPEGLFAGAAIFQMLPFSMLGSLNLLPILMTAATVWQTKLTPSTMDPQQQKMMMLMPLMFFFMFYSMASALVLYWTASQLMTIGGMLWQKHKGKQESANAT